MILRGNDTKILRAGSGEILKEPPIIDISSDYGVTKDGSNLVSAVKNRYNANVFRAPSGNEPIENGDGFEFDGVNDYMYGLKFDYTKSFIMEFWVKFNAQNLYRFGNIRNLSEANQYFILTTSNAGTTNYYVIPKLNMGSGEGSERTGTSYFQEYIIDTYQHILVQFDDEDRQFNTYIDGKLSSCRSDIVGNTISSEKYFFIGKLNGFGSNFFNGNLRKLKCKYIKSNKLNAWQYSPVSALKYAANEQIFTPPTYPNTLL
jgi:hypothetical protein